MKAHRHFGCILIMSAMMVLVTTDRRFLQRHSRDSRKIKSHRQVITEEGRSLKYEPGPNSIPEPNHMETQIFSSVNNTIVQAQTGTTATLHCIIRENSKYSVDWIRLRDQSILTVGLHTFASDRRFVVSNENNGSFQNWVLQIKYTENSDAGLYECHVTTPFTKNLKDGSIFFELQLIEAHAEIVGDSVKVVKAGSPLRLSCMLRRSIEKPTYIFWYHENRMINYDMTRGAAVRHGRQGSELFIPKAEARDVGNYSCVPSNARPASVTVHVKLDEESAAMQHDSKSATLNNQHPDFIFTSLTLMSYFLQR